jgi:hypothetical protein
MKKSILVFLVLCGASTMAYAHLNEETVTEQNKRSSIQDDINAHHGGGWGGPGRPGRPGRPGHPGPGYPPPPPGYPPQHPYRYEYVTCYSQDFRYNECYFNPYNIEGLRLYRQLSRAACIWNQTVGVYNGRFWVDRGCVASLEIVRRNY